jgi:ribose transport system substrate-binding protein
MKRLFKAIWFALAGVLVFTACSAPGKDSSQARSLASGEKNRNVTLILKNLINPFVVTVRDGALQAAKDNNINLKILTPVQADNIEEISQLTELAVVSGENDIIILFPSDSVSIIPAAQKVIDAGIPLVNLNTKIATPTQIAEVFIAVPDYDIGFNTVKRLIEIMGGNGKIALLEGVPGAQISIDRIAGAEQAIKEAPGVELVAKQAANMNRAIAMEVVQNILQAHPEITAIWGINDEMALGAVQAVDAAGKSGQILIAGTNLDPDGRTALMEGKLILDCDIGGFDQGYQAVMAAANIIDGRPVDPVIRCKIAVLSKEELP